MTTFMFWNLNRKPLQNLLVTAVREHRVDVLILAECEIPLVDLLETLNTNQVAQYSLTFSPSPRIIVLTLFPPNSIQPLLDHGGISIRRVQPPVGVDIIMVAAHLSSKMHQDDQDQALTSTRIPRLIERVEQDVGHTRTIIVGDLNMNPFEAGVVGAETLHAVMDRRIAAKVSRVVAGEERRYFYNPMWGRFGDSSFGPPGTYYYQSSRQVTYFWNMFDQVLLRPELLNYFKDTSLKILTTIGDISLLNTNGIPDTILSSDHLPILFQLELI